MFFENFSGFESTLREKKSNTRKKKEDKVLFMRKKNVSVDLNIRFWTFALSGMSYGFALMCLPVFLCQ